MHIEKCADCKYTAEWFFTNHEITLLIHPAVPSGPASGQCPPHVGEHLSFHSSYTLLKTIAPKGPSKPFERWDTNMLMLVQTFLESMHKFFIICFVHELFEDLLHASSLSQCSGSGLGSSLPVWFWLFHRYECAHSTGPRHWLKE